MVCVGLHRHVSCVCVFRSLLRFWRVIVLRWGCDMCVVLHWYQPSHKELCPKSQYTVECSWFESHCNLKTYAHPVTNSNNAHPITISIIRTQLQIQICTIRTQLQTLKIVFSTPTVRATCVRVECGLYRGTCEEYVSVEGHLSVCLSA